MLKKEIEKLIEEYKASSSSMAAYSKTEPYWNGSKDILDSVIEDLENILSDISA